MAIKTAGYVKLAKLWEKNRDSALPYHQRYFEERLSAIEGLDLTGVYVDITGNKSIVKRPEMLRLISDCRLGSVECIFTPTKGYLAANTREFCYLVKVLTDMDVDIITEDPDYRINTVLNPEGHKEALIKMADDYISLNPSDYNKWMEMLHRKV